MISAAILAVNTVLQTTTAYAHSVTDDSAGEGGSKILHAFSHFPPNPNDAHYYLEAIFLLSFIVLVTVRLVQNAKKRKHRAH